MSNIYHTEPPTQGKVVLKTSFGEIEIELWSREAPLACRNFIQLALEGHYDNTVVHRVIKGFMVQLGQTRAEAAAGIKGTSIYHNQPFKNEIHGRIRFNHRGQVAMASDKPGSNLSQFFITLDKTDWLDGKHTIFGKVVGSTIYNVLRMGEVEVSAAERPLDDVLVHQVQVLSNPFDDIVPRTRPALDKASEPAKEGAKKAAGRAVRDKHLLSFQDADNDEDDDEDYGDRKDGGAGAAPVRFRSLHEARGSSSSSSHAVTNPSTSSLNYNRSTSSDNNSRAMEPPPAARQSAASKPVGRGGDAVEDEDEDEGGYGAAAIADAEAFRRHMQSEQRAQAMQQGSAALDSLKAALLHSRKKLRGGGDEAGAGAPQQKLSALEARALKYKQKKTGKGDREAETLQRLQAFTSSLRSKKAPGDSGAAGKRDASAHADEEDHEEGEGEWFEGGLRFTRHIDDAARYGGMLGASRLAEEDDGGLVVVDPKKKRQKH